jgi:hypothetical protein
MIGKPTLRAVSKMRSSRGAIAWANAPFQLRNSLCISTTNQREAPRLNELLQVHGLKRARGTTQPIDLTIVTDVDMSPVTAFGKRRTRGRGLL